MYVALRKVLALPSYADEEKASLAKVLNTLVWITLACAIAYSVAYSLLTPLLSGLIFLVIPFFPLLIAVLVLIHRGNVRFASGLYVSGAWLELTLAAFGAGGVRSPAFSGLMMVILIAGILLGPGASIEFAVLSMGAGLLMVVVEQNAALPTISSAFTPLTWLFSIGGFYVVGAALLQLATYNINASLARARRELAERRRAEKTIARLASFPELNPNPIAEVDVRGRVDYVNPAAAKAFPDLPAQGSEHPFLGNWDSAVDALRSSRQPLSREVQVGEHYYQQMLDYIPDLECVRIYSFDISDRKKTENALRESELKFRSFIEQASDAIVLIDEEGEIIEWNRGAESLWGIPHEQAIGKSFWDVQYLVMVPEQQTPERLEQMKATALAALRTGQSKVFETPLEAETVTASGERRFIQQTMFPVKTENGYRIGSVTRDITERRQAEEALVESEERFRRLSESSIEGIVVVDGGTVIDANTAFLKMTGYAQSEIIGLRAAELLPPAGRESAAQRIVAAGTEPVEETARRKDGSIFHVELQSQTLPFKGKTVRAVAVRDYSERKRAERQIQLQLQRLRALHSIDTAITGIFDLRVILNIFLEKVTSQLAVDAAAVWLLDETTQSLEYAAGRGFRSRSIERTRLQLGESYAGQVAQERRTIQIHGPELAEAKSSYNAHWAHEGFVSYFGIPIIAKGQVKGVLEALNRSTLPADAEWLSFFETMATQGAIAIDSTTLFNDLQHSNLELSLAYDTTLEGWSRALDLRDKETEGHTQRVVDKTMRLAHIFGTRDADLAHIRRGALLHDIGKMGIPDSILLKAGPLTPDEWVIMRKHPTYVYELLSPIAFLHAAIDIPYCHHEWWDGSGYPRGLKGEEIPLAARLFTVVDVWDALCSDRPYRTAWPKARVRDHIRGESGTHFDPRVVDAFLKMVELE